jgi:hypothetical protein
MNMNVVQAGATTYLISTRCAPNKNQLPWREDPCDAFVVIRNPDLLTQRVIEQISAELTLMRTEWIETLGPKAELLHDCIDAASVSIGRQTKVGDGDPMTSWHKDLLNLSDVGDYLKLGGLGASNFKIIIVLGSDEDAFLLANYLRV